MTETLPEDVRSDDDDAGTGEDTSHDDNPDHDVASEEGHKVRLTRALHWAQQGSSPEVAQERWMRRLAGESQKRLENALSDEQVEDVAMVAAWVHAEAVVEGATIARRRLLRSAVFRFMGTVLGAGIGAAMAHIAVDAVVR